MVPSGLLFSISMSIDHCILSFQALSRVSKIIVFSVSGENESVLLKYVSGLHVPQTVVVQYLLQESFSAVERIIFTIHESLSSIGLKSIV
jgi:hypothetical protein